jgi:surfeit locus 1 family protein
VSRRADIARPSDGGGARRRPRLLAAVLLTAAGAALLFGLMAWQLQRLDWKEGLIALLETRLAQPVTALPETFERSTDEFRRVEIEGRFTGETGAHGFPDAAFLTTVRPWGPGYRIVQPFEAVGGRTVLVDRGFVPLAEKNVEAAAARPTPAPEGEVALTGALRWPQGADFFADQGAGRADNVWLTRAVETLAPLWGAEPVLVVAETDTGVGDWPRPRPVSVDLPNDHLGYAVTWGGLGFAWLAMGGLLIRRELRRPALAAPRGAG